MKKIFIFLSYCLLLLLPSVYANIFKTKNTKPQSIPVSSIQNFNSNPVIVKNLISTALTLTKKNLTYTFGSADPKRRGMDCSGIIYYLLRSLGVKNVPRQSDEQYNWVAKYGHFHKVNHADFNSYAFKDLKPGDLIFWSGTYVTKRSSSVSHVMLYLGKDKENRPIMFGSSNGRTYKGRAIWGVSVFDFILPSANSHSHFLGYGCIPTLTC
jgi:hypothetical protein